MDDKKTWVVAGFSFHSKKDAEIAKQEVQKIEYLEKRMDYKLPENILAVYNKMLDNKLVQTPVGWDYLRKMQIQMIEAGLDPGEIAPIPLYSDFTHNLYNDNTSGVAKQRIKSKQRKEKTEAEKYRTWFQLMIGVCIVLVTLIGGMFYITLKSDNPNILNYREAIKDQYSSWQQDLVEREQVVREKERELKIEADSESQ